jgi:hypothetical protein
MAIGFEVSSERGRLSIRYGRLSHEGGCRGGWVDGRGVEKVCGVSGRVGGKGAAFDKAWEAE